MIKVENMDDLLLDSLSYFNDMSMMSRLTSVNHEVNDILVLVLLESNICYASCEVLLKHVKDTRVFKMFTWHCDRYHVPLLSEFTDKLKWLVLVHKLRQVKMMPDLFSHLMIEYQDEVNNRHDISDVISKLTYIKRPDADIDDVVIACMKCIKCGYQQMFEDLINYLHYLRKLQKPINMVCLDANILSIGEYHVSQIISTIKHYPLNVCELMLEAYEYNRLDMLKILITKFGPDDNTRLLEKVYINRDIETLDMLLNNGFKLESSPCIMDKIKEYRMLHYILNKSSN